jgi:hypothetical protein
MFVTNIIWVFIRVYITTCVIKQVELEFLKLYKFCALLPSDVITKQEEKQVTEDPCGQMHYLAVLRSLQPGVLSIGQST